MKRNDTNENRPPKVAHWMARKADMPDALANAFWHQAVVDANETAEPGSAEAHAAAVENMQRSCCAYMQGKLLATVALTRRIATAYAQRALRNDAALFAHVAIIAALGALIAS